MENINGINVSITNITVPTGIDARNFSVDIMFTDVSTSLIHQPLYFMLYIILLKLGSLQPRMLLFSQ
jgi:hypothetical protein